MYDPNVIAYLFPPEGQGRDGALEAIKMPANRFRFLPPRQRNDFIDPAPDTQSRFVREATEQPEEIDDLEGLPCLVLRFSDRPKSRLGLVAGRHPPADLMMPKIKGVSGFHFALTFDEQKELVVKDLDSLVGTRVIYDGEEGQRGHGVAWSARGPGLVKGKVPVLKVVGGLQFRLVVPDHDNTSPIYLDNVAQFLEGAAAAEDLFTDLKIISRTRTELPTPGEAHTPTAQKSGRIYWKRELGRGAFAVVTYVWDVTSRAVYALKEPLPQAKEEGDWEREAQVMKGISHDNIVALKLAVFNPHPQLFFEYVSGGDLSYDCYKFTTPLQRRQIATQLLDGTAYLHEKSVVHRDIKPKNILVQDWSPNRVHVKLADFGLSKRSKYLETFCGTPLYIAPEVLCARLANRKTRKNKVKYDSLVDIWSLAVLLVKLECGTLPKYLKSYANLGTAWGKVMVEFVQKHEKRHGTNDLLSFILDDMLVVDPDGREPAKECHQKALWLFEGQKSNDGDHSDEERDPATPRALPLKGLVSVPSDPGSSEVSTIRLGPEEGQDNSQNSELSDSGMLMPGSQTIIIDLGERGSDFVDSLLGMKPLESTEFGRSDAPTPDTIQHASVVDNELWDAGAIVGASGSAVGLEGRERQSAQRATGFDSVGSEPGMAIIFGLGNAVREEDEPDMRALASPCCRKRPRPQESLGSNTGRFSSQFADQEPEDDDENVESKRSKVWITEALDQSQAGGTCK